MPTELIEEILSRSFVQTRFSFAWTCKFFANHSRNSATTYPLIEACAQACLGGNLDYLRFWFPGERRPNKLQDLLAAAALSGSIAILDWLKGSKGFPNFDYEMFRHAFLGEKPEALKWIMAATRVITQASLSSSLPIEISSQLFVIS